MTPNPCPFCGSNDVEVHDPRGQSSLPVEWYWVVCLTCQASGPPDLGKSGAVAAWNGAGGCAGAWKSIAKSYYAELRHHEIGAFDPMADPPGVIRQPTRFRRPLPAPPNENGPERKP
jgi:Lar family restriction alleviation protein